MYKKYTDSDIVAAVSNSTTIAGALRLLGLRPVGGNYYTLKVALKRLNLDTSHWKGQAWSKGEKLKDWDNYSRSNRIKKHLISERGYACQTCLLSEWRGLPITLELEHRDGDRTNNKEENLLLLCPNCHSQTPTWRRKKPPASAVGLRPHTKRLFPLHSGTPEHSDEST